MAVRGTAQVVATVATGAVAVQGISRQVTQTAAKALEVATKPNSVWGKFLEFVAKKSPRLFASIGYKLAGAGLAATVPGPGWIMAAIELGMAAWTAYELYDLWKEFNSLPTVEENVKTPTVVDNSYDANGNFTGVSPSPAATSPASSTASTQAGTMGAYKSRAGTRSTSPTPSDGAPSDRAMPTNGPIDPSKTTFADLTVEQQDAFFAEQRKQEGFKPGSLSYDLNNPGNMLFQPWQKKYGGELDTTGRGVGSVKGKFAKFPTLQDGVNAQRALWMSPSYANLPLDKALNKWVTGNPNSDMDVNMKAKNTNYKNGIYAAIGGAPTTTLASASPSTPSTGATLTQAQSTLSTLAMNNSSGGQTIVNAPTNNSVIGGGSGGGTGNMNPYNGDIMKYLLRPVA
jgi:hypothetical protein